MLKEIIILSLLLFPNVGLSKTEVYPWAELRMIELTNEDRISNGLPELKLNDKLMRSADNKADDMIKNNYFEHISPAGLTPWNFIRSSGYYYRYAGENIGKDFAKLEAAERKFMNSNVHRAVILNSRYEEIGVSVKQWKGEYLIVVHFGR